MEKINIYFDDIDYVVDKSALNDTANDMKSHLSTVINGSGATIDFDGDIYNVDEATLSAETNSLITHLGKIAGDGTIVVINGVAYTINSTKLEKATSDIHTVLDDIRFVEVDYATLAPGLYKTGSSYRVLLKSWDDLVSEGLIRSNGEIVYATKDKIAGDLVFSPNTVASALEQFAVDNLTSVVIPGHITELGYKTFYNCKSLSSVVILDGVTNIRTSAFSGAVDKPLTHVELPNSIMRVGVTTFGSCPEDAFTEYDNGMYLGNSNNPYLVLHHVKDENISSMTIHADCKVMAAYAFSGCKNLTELVVPNGVRAVEECVFSSTGIQKLTLPASITDICYHAFSGSGVTSINFEGTMDQWNAINFNDSWNNQVATVICSDGTVTI